MFPDLNCPNCNSKQNFRPKYKLVKDNWYQRYIKCSKCKREIILDYLTEGQVRKQRKLNRRGLR